MQILRTKCDFQWVTPSNTLLTLPINCANHPGDSWPWEYFWTKTLGTDSPVTTSNTEQAPASFSIDGSVSSGQTVLRGIFAYVATDPITASVSLSASATPPWDFDTGEWEARENKRLLARLYNATGGLIETFIDSDNGTAEATITLPATVCPKVLWLGAAIQPTGDDPEGDPPVYLPFTEANITFSA